ncbi:hypothetical protein ACFWEC_02070 [Micrococcus luteus]|uniref:hypothetical protein n=1 Tax=Micrococcus luteus TaxID=1270 RepID=UPI003647C266
MDTITPGAFALLAAAALLVGFSKTSVSSCSASGPSASGMVMREQYQDYVHCEHR